MASFLNTSQSLTHITPIPSPATRTDAIAMLHDHEHVIQCSPAMSKFELITSPSPAPLPAGITPLGDTKCYQVTDIVHALPAGLWDSDIVSTYEFTNLAGGLFVRIRSPMGIVLETVWTIEGEGEGPEMREFVTIKCSRLLVGTVNGQCEGNWKVIHAKMVAGLGK
ncbi:hypothetical protein D7B24_005923 [Verticillium nonalfalfae]|uniref:DUF7053 domain-containing protein n=1 Tax=Verticillium nonalfalfae TaxID=1051616 RepID=A0A3M9YJL0_9PEZI|nr:uncharacterized protein D7B24_005923 [Verticillium nonalfalfae]RNJ60773.1 hypothetical protein D7B24_005923 [Verticillium nonalfalfae]